MTTTVIKQKKNYLNGNGYTYQKCRMIVQGELEDTGVEVVAYLKTFQYSNYLTPSPFIYFLMPRSFTHSANSFISSISFPLTP
jgi:hypothetical protein